MTTALLIKSIKQRDLLNEIHKRSFYEFVKYFWSSVDSSSKFVEPAKHIEAICAHLQAVAENQIDNLGIEIPPGHGKSRVVAVLFNAWLWGPFGMPEAKIGCSTYALKLTKRDCANTAKLIKSAKYQELYGHCFKLIIEQATELHNDKNGYRLSMSNTSAATGFRFDFWIGDDLLNSRDINSPAKIEQMLEHLEAIVSREEITKKQYHQIIIGQRLGEGDAGEYARKNGYLVLCLPAEYDPSRHCTTPFFTDWRKVAGEPLFPQAMPIEKLRKIKAKMLPEKYSAQYQQLAVAKDGNIFKRGYFKHIDRKAIQIAFTFQSIDTALSEKSDADTSAISTWGVFYGERDGEGGIVLLDTWADRVGIIELLNKIVEKAIEYQPTQIIVENKVSGISVIQELQKNEKFRFKIDPFDPGRMGKSERANAAAPFAFRGHVHFFEHDIHAQNMLDQLLVFPNSKVRDLADSAVQAFLFANDTYTFKEPVIFYEGSSVAKYLEEDIDDDEYYSSTSYM